MEVYVLVLVEYSLKTKHQSYDRGITNKQC